MSSKNKTPPGAGRSPREEVDRLIAKGKYKDAVKEAKLCHRASPTPEHHRLLERAYFLRAQQLRDGGLPTAALEVATHLLEFGITDPTLTEPAAALMMAVGMAKPAMELQGRIDSPEALERLARQAADQAVLHPERAATPEIRATAIRVRAALGALSTGDGATALDGLKDISRTSPFADWRLFARGLAAFRRGDDADAQANWERLDPARAAVRITRALAEVSDAAPRDAAPSPKIEALERRLFGEPVLGPLQELGELVAQDLWKEAIRKLSAVRLALRRLDPSLAIRLTRSLYSAIIEEAMDLSFEGGQAFIKAFIKAAEPLPIDPRWNRLQGMIWDGPQGHPDDSETYWRRYLDDIETGSVVRPEERSQAKGLVLKSMGELWHDLADEDDDPKGGFDAESKAARRKAASLFEESLRLFPEHRATYQTLIELHESGKNPAGVASAAGRLLQAFPEDFDALMLLADHHLNHDEPAKGLEFAARARKLKPLDREALGTEWGCRAALARHQAIEGQCDEGRAEMEIAARLMPEWASKPHFSARRACLELKAGRPEAAQPILDEAIKRPSGHAPTWLAMAIEGHRFQLPKAEIDRFEARWQSASSGKVKAETGAALAEIMGTFVNSDMKYPGRDEHVRQVIAYLDRTTRVKYGRDDLGLVCSLVGQAPGQNDLLLKLAKRGTKLFPEAPEFYMILGSAEAENGHPRDGARKARTHFETALKLAQAEEQTNPKAAAMIPVIRLALTALTEMSRSPFDMPFGGGGIDAAFLEAFGNMMDFDAGFDDFDDDDDDRPPAPAPKPRPKGKKG